MQRDLQISLTRGLLALCVALTAGCGGPKNPAGPEPVQPVLRDTASPGAKDAADQSNAAASGPALWVLDDSASRIQPRQELPDADVERMVDALNRHYPEPGLKRVEKKGSTAVVEVRNGEMLSQEMGSTGAQGYLASVTYSLTSVPGVEQVEIRFPGGDHATPGTFRRKDFEGLFKAGG